MWNHYTLLSWWQNWRPILLIHSPDCGGPPQKKPCTTTRPFIAILWNIDWISKSRTRKDTTCANNMCAQCGIQFNFPAPIFISKNVIVACDTVHYCVLFIAHCGYNWQISPLFWSWPMCIVEFLSDIIFTSLHNILCWVLSRRALSCFASFILQNPRCMWTLTPTGQANEESFFALSNRRLTLGMMNEHDVIYNA